MNNCSYIHSFIKYSITKRKSQENYHHSQNPFIKFIRQNLFIEICSLKLGSKGLTFRNKSAILILDEGRYCWATPLATSCRTNSSFLLANYLTKNALEKTYIF